MDSAVYLKLTAGQGVQFTDNVEQQRCVNRILYIKHNAFYLSLIPLNILASYFVIEDVISHFFLALCFVYQVIFSGKMAAQTTVQDFIPSLHEATGKIRSKFEYLQHTLVH